MMFIIAKLAAEHLKPVLLELGGKAPLIVLDDADLDAAVAAAAFGGYISSGQICMSTEKIIALDSVADTFLVKLKEKVSGFTASDPALARTALGSVVDLAAATRIRTLLKDAISKGARLYQAAPAQGTLLSASILENVTADMRIYTEESLARS